MGKLNRPTVVAPNPDDESVSATSREPSPERDTHKSKRGRMQRRATFSFSGRYEFKVEDVPKSILKKDRDKVGSDQVDVRTGTPEMRGRPRSKTSPTVRFALPRLTVVYPAHYRSFSSTMTQLASSPFHGQGEAYSTQDRTHSFLECLNNHIGDAQTSQPHERNTTDGSPIDTAVRQVQEAGLSARAKALQTAGALLYRIYQGKVEKDTVRKSVFTTCVDVFERDLLDNIEEISAAYQLLSILVQEGAMPEHDFVRTAKRLQEEHYHEGCYLLLRLISDDTRVKLTDADRTTLAEIAWAVKH